MNGGEDLSQLEARTRALICSDALTAPTRAALQARMDRRFEPRDLLSPEQRRTLAAACLRLIPEPELIRRIDLPAAFETRLAQLDRGWRYAEAPQDVILHRAGLEALDAAARTGLASAFADLGPNDQDSLLEAACRGRRPMDDPTVRRWFEELLTALTEIVYAHPMVQVAIGYDGMADAHGVQAVGFAAVAAEAVRLGR